MAKREGPSRPVAVKEVLTGLLRPGDWQVLEQRRLIRQAWERAVPASVAAQSRLVDLRRRELWVEAGSNPVLQELMFLKPRILEEMEKALGPGLILDLRFAIGEGFGP